MTRNIDTVKQWLALAERAQALREEAADAAAEAVRVQAQADALEAELFGSAPAPAPAPVAETAPAPDLKTWPGKRKYTKRKERKPRVVTGDTMASTIREALRTFGPMSAADLGALVNRTPMGAAGLTAHMQKKGEIIRVAGGLYALAK